MVGIGGEVDGGMRGRMKEDDEKVTDTNLIQYGRMVYRK